MIITSEQLSFVVQGRVDETYIYEVIKSIRKNFPKSEIILSTWVGTIINDATKKLLDIYIENEDPGDGTCKLDTPININRQLISSREGIALSTRKYVVKTRTDIMFQSNEIIQQLQRKYNRDKNFIVGNGFLLAADFSTRSHKKGLEVPFWVCDFIYAGLREDVVEMFSVSNYPREYFTYFESQHPNNFPDTRHKYRYTPETYLAYNYLTKNRTITFDHSYDNNYIAMQLYSDLLINNIVILNKRQLGLYSKKYFLPFASRNIMLTNSAWKSSRKEFSFLSKDFFYDLLEYSEWLFIRLLRKRLKK